MFSISGPRTPAFLKAGVSTPRALQLLEDMLLARLSRDWSSLLDLRSSLAWGPLVGLLLTSGSGRPDFCG